MKIRWLVGGGIILTPVILLLVVSSWLLFTNSGARWGIHSALDWYNARIPGHIRISKISGAIASELSLMGIDATNRDGRRILHIERLDVSVRPDRIFHNEIQVKRLGLQNGILVMERDDAAFTVSDLAPPGTSESPKGEGPLIPALPIGLVVSQIALDNIRLVQQTGTTTGTPVRIGALRGDLSWQEHLTLNLSKFKGELTSGKQSFAFAIDDGAGLTLKSESLQTVLNLRSSVGEVRAVVHSNLSRTLASQANIDVHLPSVAALAGSGTVPHGVDGQLDVGGKVTFRLDGSGRPIVDAELACKDCALKNLGEMSMALHASLVGEEIEASAKVGIADATLNATYTGNTVGEGTLKADVDGQLSSDRATQFGLDGAASHLRASGACRLASDVACQGTLAVEQFRYETISAKKLLADVTVNVAKGRPVVNGHINIDRLNANGTPVNRVDISGGLADQLLTMHVNAANPNGDAATLNSTIDMSDGVKIRVAALKSTLRGITVESQSPFGIDVKDDSVLATSPILLQVNRAPVEISSFMKSSRSLRGELTFERVSLGDLSPLLGVPVRGRASGRMSVSGAADDPDVSVQVTMDTVAFRKMTLARISADATLKKKKLTMNLEASEPDGVQLQLSGAIPLVANFNQMTFRMGTKKRGRIDWSVKDLSSEMLAGMTELPRNLTFSVDGAGALAFNGGVPGASGEIDFQVVHPLIGRVDGHSTIALTRDSQKLTVAVDSFQGQPFALDLNSNFNLNRLLKSKIPAGEITLHTRIGSGVVTASGQLNGTEEAQFHLTVDTLSINAVSELVGGPPVDGTVTGDTFWTINLRTLELGPVKDTPWRLSWQLKKLSPSLLTHFDLSVSPLMFEIDFEGSVEYDGQTLRSLGKLDGWAGHGLLLRLPVKLDFDIASTGQRLSAAWTMPTGEAAGLDIESSLDIQELIRSRKFDLPYFTSRIRVGDAQISMDGELAGQLGSVQDLLGNGKIHLVAEHVLLSQFRPFLPTGEIDGDVSLNADFTLTDGLLVADAALTGSNISGRHFRIDEIRLQGGYANEELNVNLMARHPYGDNLTANATVPMLLDVPSLTFHWHRDAPHHMAWKIPDMSLYPFRQILNVPPVFDVSFRSDGRVNGAPRKFDATAAVSGEIRTPGRDPVPYRISVSASEQQQNMKMRLVFDEHNTCALNLHTGADIPAIAIGKQRWRDVTFKGDFTSGNFDLRFLDLLGLPVVSRPGGVMRAEAKLSGSMNQPDWRGYVRLYNAHFAIVGLANRIHGVSGDFRLENNTLSVPSLRFKSGRGKGVFSGKATMDRGVARGRGKLDLFQFPVASAGLPRFVMDLKSKFRINATDKLVDVNVALNRSKFTKPAENRNGARFVPSNSNVTVRNSDESPDTAAPGIDYNIRIQSKSPITVVGKDMDTRWNMDLQLSRMSGVDAIGGSIDSKRGTFNLFQSIFTMQKGELTLSSNPNLTAYLQLEATSLISSYTVNLGVSGNLLHPRLQLSSSPSLTEEQILSLLVSGSAEEDAETSTGAVTTLLAVQYPGIHNLLYNRFGISQLRIETTKEGSTALKAGKRVTRRSTVYTVMNPNPAKDENDLEIQVETGLTDKTSVGTAVGEKSSSFGIYRRVPIPNEKPPRLQPRRRSDESSSP